MSKLFSKKTLDLLLEEMAGENRLRRVLGPVSLTSLGIGTIIGAGIFVYTGWVAHNITGPAIILSFVVSAVACIFAALCYAEFASMAPVAGSAYTYAYATLGELVAWIIGWDLMIEYTVASASIATSWSKYFQDFIGIFHLKIPHILTYAPFDYDVGLAQVVSTGTFCDLPAIVVTFVLTILLVIGIRESARFNALMVLIKVSVVLIVIAVGAFYVNPANWKPFAPYGYGGLTLFGKSVFGGFGGTGKGMLAGAGLVFFAYIGFDAVSTHAEEARRPQRDVPIGIIASLLVCTILYIGVSAVLTGMVPYDKIDQRAPVSDAFRQVHVTWAHFIVALGALAGITSVQLVLMLSQPRVLLAMARDGLLPVSFFGAVHPRFRTPWKSTIMTGILVSVMAAFLPLSILAELVNIGTLLAFVIVCLAVLVMRRLNPEAKRPFRCPMVPLVPVLGVLFCLMLMLSLPPANWYRLGVWLLIGLLVYFFYGRHHSVLERMRRQRAMEADEPPPPNS